MITLNATHQQTKTVVDLVASTYQTVLTIGPSVGQCDIFGSYNCTVENTRGRSSMTVVVPGNGELIERYMYACYCYLHPIYILHPIDKDSHPTVLFAEAPITSCVIA